MSDDYPDEVYEYMKRLRKGDRSGWENDPVEEERLERICREEDLTEPHFPDEDLLQSGDYGSITEAEYYAAHVLRVSTKGELALRRHKPQKSKGTPGRPSKENECRAVAKEYRKGLEDGEWIGQADYLRKKHPKRNQGSARAWLSKLLKEYPEE